MDVSHEFCEQNSRLFFLDFHCRLESAVSGICYSIIPKLVLKEGRGRMVAVLCTLLAVTVCSLTGLQNQYLSHPLRGEFASLELGVGNGDCEGRDVPDHKHLAVFTLLLLFHCFYAVVVC